jgi:O-antigen/teichoic acid export membrane protein
MISGVGVTVINAVSVIIAYPIYLNYIGFEKFGVWLILTSILSILQFGDLGISQAMMKIIAEEYGKRNIPNIQKCLTISTLLLAINGGLIFVGVLIFRTSLIDVFNLSKQNEVIALNLLPYVSVLSIFQLVNQAVLSTISGVGRIDISNYIQTGGKIIIVLVATFLLWLERGVEAIIMANMVSCGFVFILGIIYIKLTIKAFPFSYLINEKKQFYRIFRLGRGIFSAIIVNAFLNPFNKMILSRYGGVEFVPVYEIAYNGALQIRAVIETALRSFVPEVSKIAAQYAEQGHARIKKINQKAIKIILGYGVPFYLAIIFMSEPLLQIWLGNKYISMLSPVFQTMMVGTFFSLLGVPAYYTLLGIEKTFRCFISNFIQTGTNILIVITIISFKNMILPIDIGFVVIFAMGLSSAYLIFEIYKLTNISV